MIQSDLKPIWYGIPCTLHRDITGNTPDEV